MRNIAVRQAGFGPTAVRVSATLWPSHAHVKVEEGDLVAIEGKYEQRTGTNGDGDPVKYHNLSVAKITVLGKADTGKEVETTEADEPEVDTDDIPF